MYITNIYLVQEVQEREGSVVGRFRGTLNIDIRSDEIENLHSALGKNVTLIEILPLERSSQLHHDLSNEKRYLTIDTPKEIPVRKISSAIGELDIHD